MVEQYGKFEATVDLTASWTNAFDYDDIRVQAVFTGPGGAQETVDGFFIKEYIISDLQTGDLTATGNGTFKIRFSPAQTGNWQYIVSCTNGTGTGSFPAQTFKCTLASTSANHGFVRSDQTNYLHFDNGSAYVPIGENMAWQNNNIYLDYQHWLQKLTANGGNYIRLWQCEWGLGLEWTNYGYEGLRKYKQDNSFYLDWLLDYCAEHGVYVMLCLNHHGQVSTQVNADWDLCPYNAANGGPCQNTWDFFTNPDAKAAIKNRFRYTVARWGYQRSIMAWELFNEIDWTDNFQDHKADVTAWHGEMAAYLKQLDVRRHLVTTSYALTSNDAPTWNLPDIDFTQNHDYFDVQNLDHVLGASNRNHLTAFDKPTFNGEFGLGGSPDNLPSVDPAGIHIHNGIWAGLFSGAMGGASQWWWDSYVESQNLYTHFAAPAALAASIPFRVKDFRPVDVAVKNAPAALDLTPVLGWSELADTTLTILSDGTLSPADARLGQFLYGSAWNTQYRRPPVFHVDFPQSGPFTVKTGTATGQSPKLAVWVDGQLKLQTDAIPDQTYTVTIPAGAHTIKVDNTGTDWILIASYAFGSLGTGIDAFALRQADHAGLAAWIRNKNYNHVLYGQNGAPAAISGATLQIDGLTTGIYHAKWYNCLNGNLVADAPVTVSISPLNLPIPDLVWDAALVLDQQPAAIGEIARNQEFRVYPNPVNRNVVHIALNIRQAGLLKADLLDASGSWVQSLYTGRIGEGEQTLRLPVKAGLPAGIYWISLQTDTISGVQAVLISQP